MKEAGVSDSAMFDADPALSVYHFHFRAPFFNPEGAKCVPVKVFRRAFVTAVLASEEQSNKALQSPLHCPGFIKTINLDVEGKVTARECPPFKRSLFAHQLHLFFIRAELLM